MAAKAGTILEMSSRNSTQAGYLTFATLTTAASSGVYFDIKGKKADRLIIVTDITATNVASASATNRVVMEGGSTVIQYAQHIRGDLMCQFTTNRAASARLGFLGPFDVSRFKDSNERIVVSCSAAGTNIKAIGAILI